MEPKKAHNYPNLNPNSKGNTKRQLNPTPGPDPDPNPSPHPNPDHNHQKHMLRLDASPPIPFSFPASTAHSALSRLTQALYTLP